MKKSILRLLILSVLFSCDKNYKKTPTKTKQLTLKSVKVITSSSISDLKFSMIDTLIFVKRIQPLETEASIEVNPIKTFQTFLT